jgi:hypothetical protein
LQARARFWNPAVRSVETLRSPQFGQMKIGMWTPQVSRPFFKVFERARAGTRKWSRSRVPSSLGERESSLARTRLQSML